MIQKENILTAVGLAEMLAERGQTVLAKPSTVVAEMVKLTNQDVLGHSRDDFTIYAENVENLTTGTLDVPSQHDMYIDSVRAQIGKAVRSHISFAKNVVKPLVVDYAEGVIQYVNEFKYPNACDQFSVVVADLPELLEDEGFVDTLNKYVNKSIITPEKRPSLGKKTGEELLSLMLTGDREADQAITAWYSRLGNDYFVNLWENTFRSNETDREILSYVGYNDILSADLFAKTDYALAIYLWATKLFDVVEDGMAGMSMAGYQECIAQTRDFAGALLTNSISRTSGYESSKILVIGMEPEKQTAKVFGKVYRNWLASGGTVETILGLIVSGRSVTTQVAVDEVRPQLLAAWQTHSTFFTAAESNKRFDYFKDALIVKFKQLMQNLTAEEREFTDSTTDYMVSVDKRFIVELEKLRSNEMDDVYGVALKLLCRSRFYYTDAEAILSDIVEAAKANPNVDVREAALIATLNYVSDYVAAQMTLQTA